MHSRLVQVYRSRFKAQQDMHTTAGEVFELVNLIRYFECLVEMMSRGMTLVFDVDGDLLMPRVLIEISADQFAILRPLVESIGCTVNTDESFARCDELEERGFLRVRNRKLSRRVEDHRIIWPESITTEHRDVL